MTLNFQTLFLGPEIVEINRVPMLLSFPTPMQDEVMWLFGGRDDDVAKVTYDTIFKLVCQSKPETGSGCQWKSVEDQKLKVPRSNGVIVTL